MRPTNWVRFAKNWYGAFLSRVGLEIELPATFPARSKAHQFRPFIVVQLGLVF